MIRTARPEEATAVALVHIETWRVAYAHVFPREELEHMSAERVERRAELHRRSPPIVAEVDGEIVGFVSVGPANDSDSDGEIYAIYVLPQHQGHGHGSALLRAGARELLAHGSRGIVLWVLRENAPSRLFYERMGGRHLRGQDEEREIAGVIVTEAGYAWDDVSALAGQD